MESEIKIENMEITENTITTSLKSEIFNTSTEKPKKGRKKLVHDYASRGLDNVEARSYINQKVHDLVEFDEEGKPLPETVIPFIDGGTEGFRGQAKVIIPYTTSCFDCDTEIINTKRNTYAMCTIAENPRVPEHCIEYAFTIEWKKHHNKPVDKDSIEDVEWIYKTALERAKKYNIELIQSINLLVNII